MLVESGRVALIKRVRQGKTYYLFPGGGVDVEETFEAAAVREAREELGLDVRLGALVHSEEFRGMPMRYYEATRVGGDFGTGVGEELVSSGTTPRGTYEATWVQLHELAALDVRPRSLAQLVGGPAPDRGGRPQSVTRTESS